MNRRAALLVLGWAASLGAGCRCLPPLPPADFSAPGWQVRQGQAVWQAPPAGAALAGELLLATNANGDSFVQFAKPPFPLATAQTVGDRWQIEFGARERCRRGRGRPPERLVWFQLPAAMKEGDASRPWIFSRDDGNAWRLENSRTGERLKGEFFP